MVVKFKNGGVRQVPFNSRLAARLIRLGHKIDYEPETSEHQREKERSLVQKEYDALCLAEQCRSYTLS